MHQDFKELLSAFNAGQVRYLIVDGYAVSLHAQPRATKDLDILIGADAENSKAMYAVLAKFGAPIEGLSAKDFAEPDNFFRMGAPPVMVDIMPKITGVEFEEAWSWRVEVQIDDDLSVPFISRQDLLVAKLAAGRAQDLIDVDALRESSQSLEIDQQRSRPSPANSAQNELEQIRKEAREGWLKHRQEKAALGRVGRGAAISMDAECLSDVQQIRDGAEAFNVTVVEASQTSKRLVLFAAGRGGNPERHLPLLRSVAALGCTVIAPHFDMLTSSAPGKVELDNRVRRLEASAMEYFKPDLPTVGIGHSIGAVTLLVLAGGEARTLAGDTVLSGSKLTIDRLALFAPPTDFFRRPGALKSLRVPIRIWVGARDSITPPTQAQFLKEVLSMQGPIDICLDEEAGHFSYMDELPPKITDSHPNRSKFLASLANDVGRFVIA